MQLAAFNVCSIYGIVSYRKYKLLTESAIHFLKLGRHVHIYEEVI